MASAARPTLRRKLDVPGGTLLLHSIRGAGFILDERAR